MEPDGKRSQLVGERIRIPITSINVTSIKKEEEPRIPGIVEEEGTEEKSLHGGILEEEKPIVSEPPRASMVIQDSGLSEKVPILGEKEPPKEEKEGEKTRVTMVEEPKGLAIPEGKLPTGRYTLNIASFRDKGNADRFVRKLEGKGYEASVEKADIPQKGTWYRVAVGQFSSKGEALAFAHGLKEKGINYSFVRKLKEMQK
jgi:cell division protein FtsN